MQRRVIVLLVIVVALTIGSAYTGFLVKKESRVLANVSRVIDGDTIDLADSVRVRLLGINTPEKNENFYQQAKNYLNQTIGNKEIWLEAFGKDKYGRILGYIYINDTFINLEIIKNGLASTYLLSPDQKYYLEFKNAEKEAKASSLGIWKSGSITCISIINFNYDASGDDNANLNGEYVTFRNGCDYPVDMSKWEIKDEGTNIYKFKAFVLLVQGEFTIYSGAGKNSNKSLFWNSKRSIWNNDKDTLFLKDANGNLILTYGYPN